MRRISVAISACFIALLLNVGTVSAAPEADLWPRWQRHDAQSTVKIDHSPWDQLLRSYLDMGQDGIIRFAYRHVGSADRATLDQYVTYMTSLQISSYNRSEQFAYWVNLYNALTVRLVLTHYPEASILDIDISPGLFSNGPWGKALVTIEDEPLSLDDIEHRILRPIWHDPRVHYALNCAAIGCPSLVSVAFTAKNTERALNMAATDYINHRRGAHVRDGKLYVSSIYAWFAEDFGDGSDADIIAHLRRYAVFGMGEALKHIDTIAGDRYDWSLNDAASTAKVPVGRGSFGRQR